MNLPQIIHAIVGLAIIAAVSILGAIGTITGTQALDAIGVISSFLLGSGAVIVGNATGSTAPVAGNLGAPVTPPAV